MSFGAALRARKHGDAVRTIRDTIKIYRAKRTADPVIFLLVLFNTQSLFNLISNSICNPILEKHLDPHQERLPLLPLVKVCEMEHKITALCGPSPTEAVTQIYLNLMLTPD